MKSGHVNTEKLQILCMELIQPEGKTHYFLIHLSNMLL